MRTYAAIVLALSSLLLASAGSMARADKVDTGVEPTAPAVEAPVGIVIKATINKDGKEVEHHYFGHAGQTAVFDTKAKCVTFITLPFFVEVLKLLHVAVERDQPGATATVSCVPIE